MQGLGRTQMALVECADGLVRVTGTLVAPANTRRILGTSRTHGVPAGPTRFCGVDGALVWKMGLAGARNWCLSKCE